MHVLFIGGTNEVGASCLAVQIADQWIVVDAGVRVDRSNDSLPDFALLEDKDVRAIFVTHAHADHIGALPLLHQAYPNAPIFASRATGLLMEVMLSDAQRIMQRRAVEEMELPLYPSDLVERMLNQVRSLPVGEAMMLPELPNVTVMASLAGHIAGAVSFGFVAPDGSLVISGDISVTEQRTVPGAQPPPIERPDLLVLEATYGSRFHANRQAEEQRLAQAVADGIEHGGHVLIPCFGLGRGQEVLLSLVDAQQKGLISEFPIYVDGLVRRVCSTYHLLPEALTSRLTRQIRKGYYPFAGRRITYVKDEHDRERILAGVPACIISSSGMLTGGPSVWYAKQLVSNPLASIMITSYQDEESPGRRLLDIIEKKHLSLELDGITVEVNCHVAKYSLSAHADAGELVSYATLLQPRHIALVHGDDESRSALHACLNTANILLPNNATEISITGGQVVRPLAQNNVTALSQLAVGIGNGLSFTHEHVEELWQAVSQIATLRIVTARELAFIWDGHADAYTITHILDVLKQDPSYRYFMPHRALEEAFYVRGKSTSSELFSDLIGQILFVQVAFGGSPMPALCRGLLPTASVRVQFAPGISDRIRYAYSAILDVLGALPDHIEERQVSSYLTELSRQARVLRRSLSVHKLVLLCQEHTAYSLSDLCVLAEVSPTHLVDRLAIADLVQRASSLFYVQQMPLFEEGSTLYTLAPGWQEALKREGSEQTALLIDRRAILQIIEHHIGNPPDLYRRRFDPETGDVTLSFHFPDIARKKYLQALAEASEEADVVISIAPYAHQDALSDMVLQVLPTELTIQGHPSVYQETKHIHFEVSGQLTPHLLKEVQDRFHALTDWHLILASVPGETLPVSQTISETGTKTMVSLLPTLRPIMNEVACTTEPCLSNVPGAIPVDAARISEKPYRMEDALHYAQAVLKSLPGYLRVKVEIDTQVLVPRFTFPDIAKERYAVQLAAITQVTGWNVRLHMIIYPPALREVLARILPKGISCVDTPSIYQDKHKVGVVCVGHISGAEVVETQSRFLAETGWMLELRGSSVEALTEEIKTPTAIVLSRMETMLRVIGVFGDKPDFYRIGVDDRRAILWLHFYFPELARRRYAAELAHLSQETGWKIDVDKDVHQKALVEVVLRLLPAQVTIIGKKSVLHEQLTLRLTCTGSIEPTTLQELQRHFVEETGWQLVLDFSGQQAFYIAEKEHLTSKGRGSELKEPMAEQEAQALVQARLSQYGVVQRQLVDVMRHILLVYFKSRNAQKYIDDNLLIELEQVTGWQIRLA